MKNQQQQDAQRLFFQTDLSKSRIADELGISRTTLHQWIDDNHWEHLKRSASVMPSMIAENCYHIMDGLTKHILSPEREGQPATSKEINDLHKLSLTISRLKKRSTVNESMEMFAFFMEGLNATDPALAQAIEPHITSYITGRAAEHAKFSNPNSSAATTPITNVVKESLEEMSYAQNLHKEETIEEREARLDQEDILRWTAEGNPIIDKINSREPLPEVGDSPVMTPAEAALALRELEDALISIAASRNSTIANGPVFSNPKAATNPLPEFKGNRAFRRKQAHARKAA